MNVCNTMMRPCNSNGCASPELERNLEAVDKHILGPMQVCPALHSVPAT